MRYDTDYSHSFCHLVDVSPERMHAAVLSYVSGKGAACICMDLLILIYGICEVPYKHWQVHTCHFRVKSSTTSAFFSNNMAYVLHTDLANIQNLVFQIQFQGRD